MIKETDGTIFEEMRSLNQSLTFTSLTTEFQTRNLPFTETQMQTLKFMTTDHIYTNLAWLLSDQCTHSIKVAVFQGNDQTVFKDRQEFKGSLMKQMHDVYDYIDYHNKTHSTYDKLLRIDQRDYPELSLREALINALVHRDYSIRSSTFISIYDNRIEFISIGGLVSGITMDDIMMGVSICRNQNLANVFYRLQLIEAYGTGLRKMIHAYEHTTVKPIIETSEHVFKVVLPNIHADNGNKAYTTLSQDDQRILEYVKQKGSVTRSEIEHLLELSTSTITRLLNRLIEQQALKKVGKGKKTRYIV